jgi:poly(3-hydroxybutyrate) depolymerase
MRMRLWIGVSLLVGALWTGAALGGVIAGDSTTAPPANDDFANAIVLTGANVTRTGDTNVDATAEAGEPDPVAGAHGGASVWYFWTAPSNDEVVIDLAGSDFDTILGV